MASTALDLAEFVLPPAPLRQWVLTFPFAWRSRLGFDAKLLGALTRIFVQTVLGFYTKRMTREGVAAGQSGAVVVLQRLSSDLRLMPHLHVLFIDGVYEERREQVLFHELPHLSTREVGANLEEAVRRMARHLKRRGLLDATANDTENLSPLDEGHAALCASAASGQEPPAGPELRHKERPMAKVARAPLVFDKPLCATLDGFSLHAASRAGALDTKGREALIRYVLRPPIAQERVTSGPDGLVRIVLKREFSDGTIAVDLDPLSLLSRLAASVPAPRMHMVRYAGVLGSASKLRSRIVPNPKPVGSTGKDASVEEEQEHRRGYRCWAKLLHASLGIDALICPRCQGRMRVIALVREPSEIRRFLANLGEPTSPPRRAPARGPPYWASRPMRVRAGDEAA